MNSDLQSALPERLTTVLLVEDDEQIAQMVAEILAENGFETKTVRSAAEMDRVLQSQQFDLFILDAMLPGEDGFSICRRIRNAFVTPIIMLTALGKDVDRIIGLELGADDY